MYGSRPPVAEVIGGLFCTNMPTNMRGKKEALRNVYLKANSNKTDRICRKYGVSIEKQSRQLCFLIELCLLGSIIAIKSATHFSTLENKKV